MEHSFEKVNPFSPAERLPQKNILPADMSDTSDPHVRRERFFSQDQRILDAVSALATKIKSCPRDSKFPDVEPGLLVVGGFARDALIGKHPKDADVEVYGVSVERLEDFLDQLYGNQVNKVGQAFGIFKVALGDGLDLDVSIPRRESKIGTGHKGFEVQGDPGMSVIEAARRRDFTFNALAADPLTGVYEDHFGGIEDLKSRTLRVTDAERFQDDPLRVYRALQFVARMNLHTDEQSFDLMKEMVERGDLDQLTAERITEEWKKLLLKSERPATGLNLGKQLSIVDRYYPELNSADSWNAVGQSIDRAARVIHQKGRTLSENERLQVMLCALCSVMDQQGKEVQKFLAKTSFSKKEIIAPIAGLIKEQSEPTRIWKMFEAGELSEKQVANEIRKVVKRIHPASPETLLAVNEAKERHETPTMQDDETYPPVILLREYLLRHPEWLDPKKDALINGADLKALGIPAGPEMGKVMRMVEDARDRGEIETHEEALAWFVATNKK